MNNFAIFKSRRSSLQRNLPGNAHSRVSSRLNSSVFPFQAKGTHDWTSHVVYFRTAHYPLLPTFFLLSLPLSLVAQCSRVSFSLLSVPPAPLRLPHRDVAVTSPRAPPYSRPRRHPRLSLSLVARVARSLSLPPTAPRRGGAYKSRRTPRGAH